MKHKILYLITICLLSITFVKGQQTIDVSVGITQPSELKANAGSDKLIDLGEEVQIGSASAATGGTSSYQYFWSPNTNIGSTTIASPLVFPTDNTTYTLTVTDAKGCTATENVLVSVNTCLNPTNISIDNVGETEATISWDGSATSFNIRYKKTGASSWVNTFNTTQNRYTLTSLQNATQYDFEIQAICGSKTSDWTADVFSTIEHVDKFVLNATKIEALPNPILENGRLRVSTTVYNSGDADFEGSIVCAIVEEQTDGTYKVLEVVGGGRDVLTSGKSVKLNYELDEVTTPSGWYYITFQYKADNASSYTGLKYTELKIEKFTAGLEVNASDLIFTPLYNSKTLRISANIDWQVNVTKGSSWITLDKTSGSGNGTFGFSIDENPNESDRRGKIEVTAEGIRRTIIISQAAKAPAATPDRIRITNMLVRQNGTKLDVSFYVADPQSRRLNFLTAYFANVKDKYATGTEYDYNVLEDADYANTVLGKKFYFTIDMSQGRAASLFDPYNEYEFKVGCLTSDGEKANVGTPGGNNENNHVFLIKSIPHAGGGGIVPTAPSNVKVTSTSGSTILGVQYETSANTDAYEILVNGQKHKTVQNKSKGRTINTTIEVPDEGTHEIEVRAINSGSETKSPPSPKQVVEVTNIPDEPDERVPTMTIRGLVTTTKGERVANAEVVFSDAVTVYTNSKGFYYRKDVSVGKQLSIWVNDNRYSEITPFSESFTVSAENNRIDFLCTVKTYNDDSGNGERPSQDNRELELASTIVDPNLTVGKAANPITVSVRNISGNTWSGHIVLYLEDENIQGEKVLIAKEYVSNIQSSAFVEFDNINTNSLTWGNKKLHIACKRGVSNQSISTGLIDLKPTSSANPVTIFVNTDYDIDDLEDFGNELDKKLAELEDILDRTEQLVWMLGETGKFKYIDDVKEQIKSDQLVLKDYQAALNYVNSGLDFLAKLKEFDSEPDKIKRYSKIAEEIYNLADGDTYLNLIPHAQLLKTAIDLGQKTYQTWNMTFKLGTEFSVETGNLGNLDYKISLRERYSVLWGNVNWSDDVDADKYAKYMKAYIVCNAPYSEGSEGVLNQCLGGGHKAFPLKIKKSSNDNSAVILSPVDRGAVSEAGQMPLIQDTPIYLLLVYPYEDSYYKEDLCKAYKEIIPLKEPYIQYNDLGMDAANIRIYLRCAPYKYNRPYLYIKD